MHLIRKLIHDQVIEVLFFPTEDQVADIFIKSLTEVNFSKFDLCQEFMKLSLKGDRL